MAVQKIKSVTTSQGTRSVGTSMYPDCFDKITTVEKYGDMAPILWYQCWYKGEIMTEINSLHVIEVEYELTPDTIPL